MQIAAPISVVVADDHDNLRAAIIASLRHEHDVVIVGEAKDGVEAVEKACALEPDVMVIDITMPHLDGIAATERIIKRSRTTKVLIVSQHEDEQYVLESMRTGASGYLLKDALYEELAAAIRVVHRGGHFFTPRIAERIVKSYLGKVVSTKPA